MNKINVTSSDWILSSTNQVDPESARRFIILVPPVDFDLSLLTQRIWELAKVSGAQVLLIGLYGDTAQELRLRRDLVTIAAMLNDGKVTAESEMLLGRDWAGAVRARWQPGDMVMCFSEQRLDLSQKPLSQILQADLDVPVYILTGLNPQYGTQLSWTTQTKAWLGAIAILIGFFLLQVKIIDLETGGVTILLTLSVLVEFWLLWFWNSLIG